MSVRAFTVTGFTLQFDGRRAKIPQSLFGADLAPFAHSVTAFLNLHHVERAADLSGCE